MKRSSAHLHAEDGVHQPPDLPTRKRSGLLTQKWFFLPPVVHISLSLFLVSARRSYLRHCDCLRSRREVRRAAEDPSRWHEDPELSVGLELERQRQWVVYLRVDQHWSIEG